ncbi:MAG TPA: hypothetical protein PKA32_00995 [Candidatus Gracilibacteria bacterium]|nr:hypothetical protein [Candidatus Gracilibacteria bacterium]
MKELEQKLEPKWWKRSEGARAYHLREFSGILIGVWCIYFLNIPATLGFTIQSPWYGFIMNGIGLVGAILHSSSWLKIMPKLTPFNLKDQQQNILFATLILVWLAVSAATLLILWPGKNNLPL